MSETGWIILLTALGGGFEALGVLLIVKEIATDRRLARHLFPHDHLSGPISMSATGTVTARGTARVRRPLIDRVGILERAMDSLRDAIETSAQATKIETRKAIADAATRLAQQDKERDEALRRFIHDQLTGGIGWRLAGVGLVLSGIVCTTAAAVWAIAAA